MSEAELIKMLQEKESKETAFRFVVSTYKERLYLFVRKFLIDHHDTDEVVQLTFIKVFKYVHGYKGNSSLFTWICAIARKEAINVLQLKAKRYNLSIDELTQHAMSKLSAESMSYPGKEIQLRLQQAVSCLPSKQREVFNMKYFDKLLFREIAEITGTSEGGLKANYHLAVKRLKELLQEVYH